MEPPKRLIRIGLVFLIVVAGVLVVRAVLNFTEGRALARTLADLKEQGIPLSAKDLAPPCPEADNAARLWTAAENLMTIEDGEDRELMVRVWQDYIARKPFAPADKAALEDLILRNERAFGLIAEMGAKPCFQYRDPEAMLLEIRLPALKMIRATRLLGFAALLRAESGDMPGAIQRIRTGLRFAPLPAADGVLMVELVGDAIARMQADFLAEACRDREIGEEFLLELIAELDASPWSGRLSRAFRGERVSFIEVGTWAGRAGRKERADFFGEPSYLVDAFTWLVRPLLKRDLRKTLPLFAEMEAQALLPYYSTREFVKTMETKRTRLPWYSFVSKWAFPSVGTAFLKKAMLEATYSVSRTGLACRVFKLRTGSYPADLEMLVPALLPEVPIDPFTGKRLAYRREGDGFIVYSLGANEKDDGGLSVFQPGSYYGQKPYEKDDWAWRESK